MWKFQDPLALISRNLSEKFVLSARGGGAVNFSNTESRLESLSYQKWFGVQKFAGIHFHVNKPNDMDIMS